MKKLLFVLVAMLVTMFSVSAFAYTPPAAPANGGYVVDQAGKLSPSQIQQLNQKIDRISKSTKNEFGILLLQDMGGESIEDVANATYKGWGVGKKGLDNGCLIVVSIKERKSRIETGKGVEGEVPDLKANDILKANLNPHLKNGDFYGAFDDTLNALSAQMESRQGQKADPPRTASPSCDVSGVGANTDGGFLFAALGVGAVILFFAVRAMRRSLKEVERLEREREDLAAQTERFLREEELKRKKAEEVAAARHRAEEAAAETARAKALSIPTPVVPVPELPVRQSVTPQFKPVVSVPRVTPPANLSPRPGPITGGGSRAIATAAPIAVAAATNLTLQREEERRRRERREEEERTEARRRREEEERAEARRRREREEDDRRRREEDDRRSSSSSSSSFDWGSSSSSSGSDSGFGGFGGGDSGGGGSSSDW